MFTYKYTGMRAHECPFECRWDAYGSGKMHADPDGKQREHFVVVT